MCSAFFVYMSQSASASVEVMGEVDAALSARNSATPVRFMLFVPEDDARSALRADLRSLQAPVLGDATYSQVFPELVAECWRSLLERRLIEATGAEKAARLEAQEALRLARDAVAATVFPKEEEAQFTDLAQRLAEGIDVAASVTSVRRSTTLGALPTVVFPSTLLGVLLFAYRTDPTRPDRGLVRHVIAEDLNSRFPLAEREGFALQWRIGGQPWSDLLERRALSFGLMRSHRVQRSADALTQLVGGLQTVIEYTEKMGRFAYWAEANGRIPPPLSLPADGGAAAPYLASAPA
jgi:hypothetical protein